MQNLFSFYSDSYMLVSVHSSIIDDLVHFQRLKVDYGIYTAGEGHYSKLKYHYYEMSTKLLKLGEFLGGNSVSRSLEQWKSIDHNIAFVADLDAQFLFVPKTWVRYILMTRILRVQACLLYDDQSRYLTSDKFIQNQNLMHKLRSLNHTKVDNIMKQARSLT